MVIAFLPRLLLPPLCLVAAAWCTGRGASGFRAVRARTLLVARGVPTDRPGPATLPPADVLGRWRDLPIGVFSALIALAVGMAALTGGALAALCVVVAVGVLGLARWSHRLGAGARYERSLVVATEELARQLRSGAGTSAALAVVASTSQGPLRADLDGLLVRVEAGATLGEALGWWAEQRPLSAVRLTAGAIGVGTVSGGLRARTADGLAAALRQRDRARREAASLAGQAQLSAVVMTVTPLAFAAVLAAGDRAARDFLVRSPAGLACLAVGLTLDLAAAAWMVRLTASVA